MGETENYKKDNKTTKRQGRSKSITEKTTKQTQHMSKMEGKGEAHSRGSSSGTEYEKEEPEVVSQETSVILRRISEMGNDLREEIAGLRSDMNKRRDEIDQKFENKYSSLKLDFEMHQKTSRGEMGEMRKVIGDIEEGMNFQSAQIKTIETENKDSIKDMEAKFENMRESMLQTMNKQKEEFEENFSAMEKKYLRLEKKHRQYNLLFYGIPKVPFENTFSVLRKFMKENLNMDAEYAETIWIQNAHRIRREGGNGPDPIIAKFVLMEDREYILRQVRFLPKGMRILTDMPVVMKKERGKLASEAYHLRNPENPADKLQTRIIEEGMSLVLEIRKGPRERWTQKKVVKFD